MAIVRLLWVWAPVETVEWSVAGKFLARGGQALTIVTGLRRDSDQSLRGPATIVRALWAWISVAIVRILWVSAPVRIARKVGGGRVSDIVQGAARPLQPSRV